MNLNLSAACPPYITIHFELADVSAQSLKRGEKMEIIMLLLVTYYPNITTMLRMLFVRKTGA